MLTLLHNLPGGNQDGFISEDGWRYLGATCLLKKGDVACLNQGNPSLIKSHLASNANGFIVSGYAGYTTDYLWGVLNKHHKNKDMVLGFWRRVAKFKRPYVPSLWAKPVPLP